MSSSATRSSLVTDAITIAGRDVSIKTLVNGMLNRMLRQWALEHKYVALRKTGSTQTLAQGASTVSLPSDLGSGMDNIIFGDEATPIYEKSMDEFAYLGGFRPTNSGTGRPWFYAVDEQASVFRFNAIADKAYTFIPIYYYLPADIDTTSAGDGSYLWMPNDELIIQGLVHRIYQYMGDTREDSQLQFVDKMNADYKRGATPVGGGQPKVQLSRSVFKRRRY